MEPSNDNSFGSLGTSGGGIIDVNASVDPNANASVNTNSTANMNYNMPASTGTGDIIIEGDKKSKKGLIFGLALLVGVIVVGGMVAAIIFLGQKGESVRDKFNKIINYVVSGEESSANYTGAYSNNATYYFNKQQEDVGNRAALYAKTSMLLNDFMVAYDKLGNKNSFSKDATEFGGIMTSEEELLDFAMAVGAKKTPDIHSVVDVYNKEGANTKQWFDRYYDFAAISDNAYTSEYKEYYDKYIDAQIERAKLYISRGCVSGNTIRSGCIQAGDELSTKHENLISQIKGSWSKIKYYDDIGVFFTIRLFKANELLNNTTALVMEITNA